MVGFSPHLHEPLLGLLQFAIDGLDASGCSRCGP